MDKINTALEHKVDRNEVGDIVEQAVTSWHTDPYCIHHRGKLEVSSGAKPAELKLTTMISQKLSRKPQMKNAGKRA